MCSQQVDRKNEPASSPAEGDGEGADLVGGALAAKFFGAADDAEIEAEGCRPDQREASLQVGHQGLFGDAQAVAEGVAVKKDVVRDDAALGAGEEIEPDLAAKRGGVEIVGSR